MSQFQTRQEYTEAATSEKIVLAQVNAKARVYVFNGPDGSSRYTKTTPYFVAGLKADNTDLIEVENAELVTEETFFYDIETSLLYFRLAGDADPSTFEMIITYKFFFANKGLTTTHNLQDISEDVFYDGRIISSPGYKHKIGIDQALSSLVGEGSLILQNNDGGLDGVFDKLIFENQDVVIYSWNQDLEPDQSRVIYRGLVTNKKYDGTRVTFKIKDLIFNLLDSPTLTAYGDDDQVSESAKGQYKRRVYGRVDGLRCQSISQVADGIILTGKLRMLANSVELLGLGTSFLTQVVQGDTIVVDSQEFQVETVDSDLQITVTDESLYGFSNVDGLLQPERGSTLRNRTYLATGHVCAEVTHLVVEVPQFNRVKLNDTSGLFSGDFVEFVDNGERIEIKTVAPDNILVLRQNVVTKPTIGTQVIRRPIQEVYIGSRRVNADDYEIFNSSTGSGVTFQDDAEFNLARPRNTAFSATFTNGSRTVNVSNNEVSLQDIFTPGDFVKPDNITYTQFYKVVNVNTNSLDLNLAFSQPNIIDIVELISPEYLEDDSVVSVNILGKTVDNTASGEWISTVAQAQKDLLVDINISALNSPSFVQGEVDGNQLISMAIPEGFTNKTLPNVKTLSDKLNKSIRSSLTLDNDLLIKFQVLNVFTQEEIKTITDSDVLSWSINATNGKTYRSALSKYRFTDVDLNTLEDGNRFLSYESEFVARYIGTNKVDELDLYLYEERDAEISAHRHLYYNRLGVSTLKLTTDLRLENVEIGEVVIADFDRLYKRFGTDSHRKKLMLVIGKTVTGEKTELELSDLGNTFNASSFITPNDAPDFVVATDDEKLIYGYITDNNGITNNDEDTAGIHLIS